MNSTLTSIRWTCASNSLFMNPGLAFAAWNHVKIGWCVSWFQNGAITRDHWWAHRLQQFNVKVCRPGQSKQRQPWRFLSHVRWNLELISPHYCPFVKGIHRWQGNSPHKGPVTWKKLPFDDVIMFGAYDYAWTRLKNSLSVKIRFSLKYK